MFEPFASILTGLKFSLEVFESYLKRRITSSSLKESRKTCNYHVIKAITHKLSKYIFIFPNYFRRNIIF